jgi:hypothetical protein
MKAIVIGIMPQEKIRERVLAIACGEFKPKLGVCRTFTRHVLPSQAKRAVW